MKKFLIMVIAGLFLIPVYAQKGKRDLVYLKSGGIIRGQLIHHDDEKVKIISAGNEWVFKLADVDSVLKFRKAVHEAGPLQNYFFDTSMGVLVGNSVSNQSAPFSFMASFNYRIADKLYVGAGLGSEFLDESYMPTFAQLQYRFRNARFTPFFNLQVGYQVPLEDGNRQHYTNYSSSSSYYWPYPQQTEKLDTEGGILINPTVGFQQFISDNFGWFFSFGYRHHQLNYSGDNGYKLETNYSRLSLKIGFIFN
jgi:hypothetical protein